MKNVIKYGLIGFAGYLIGFYEMKYKVMKIMLESQCKKDTEFKKEEEAQ